MWSKIYLVALAIALLVITSLSFYSYNWLTSIDAPVNVVQNYEYYSNLAWLFLWLSSIFLMVLANVFVLESSTIVGFVDDIIFVFCNFYNPSNILV